MGVVKIDVQGHEHGVIGGMKQLASRKNGFPNYIFYENEPNLIEKAGYTVGASERFSEQPIRIYACRPETRGDILCFKEENANVRTR